MANAVSVQRDSQSLASLDTKQVRELIQSVPAKKRATISKALLAAAQHIKDSQGNYDKAFEFACLVIENEWLLGDDLKKMASAGLLATKGRPEAKSEKNLIYVSELGLSQKRAHNARRIRDHFERKEALDWAAKQYDAERQKLPRVGGATVEAKRVKLGKSPEAAGVKGDGSWQFSVGDCLKLPYEQDSIDLVFCSPPYEGQREYGDVEFDLCGEAWVAWAADCFIECLRVCKGLVAWVVEGSTENYRYSCTPFLLMAELHRRGYAVRKPCVYQRNGIPGTGGPDWLRNDWEPVICATKYGKLPWSDNTAMGKPPVVTGDRKATNRNKDGSRKDCTYKDPDIANPGNIITGKVGSGQLGWKDAHLNEAPFPQWLAEFFIKSFCPPGGTVLDPFSGSGTTVAAAVSCGRNGIGMDIRDDQVWLGETRLLGLTVTERKEGQQLLV